MKKILSSIFTICAILIFSTLLSACGDKHKHNYVHQCYNSNYHWEQCDCGEKINYKSHVFGEWQEITVGPYNCMNPMNIQKSCEVCGCDVIQVIGGSHNESDWIIDQDSTCTATGTQHKECTVCEEIIDTETIAVKEHNITEWTELQPADCVNAQVLERHCTTCDTQYETMQGAEALGHTESEWIIGTVASCTGYGYRYKNCINCYTRLESEYYGPIEHSMTEWAELIPGDCNNPPILERYCTTCDTQYETMVGEPALGHYESEWIVEIEPTCYSYGVSYKKCLICNKETRRDTQVLKPHIESEWIIDQDSTCTQTGSKHIECTKCYEVLETGIIELKVHSMTEWAELQPADCINAQVLERHCITCDTQNETMQGANALGHTESEWIVETEPTCTTYGVRYKECVVCYVELEKDTQVSKLPHTESEWIIDQDSTCTTTGTKHIECDVCHEVLETSIIALKEHIMTEWVQQPPTSCTESVILERHCTTCDTMNQTKSGPAVGHIESDWIIDQDSTCTATGTQHKECTVCAEIIDTETIEVKEHNITDWAEQTPADCENAQVLERHCITCDTQNETMQGANALGHTESEWIVETEPTCTTYGVRYKECVVCHVELEKDTQVSKLPHTESEWIIDQDSTCTAAGTQHIECTECHEVLETSIIEMKEHNITDWEEQTPADCENAQVLERHCTTCDTQNEIMQGAEALGHNWSTPVKSTQDGYYLFTQTCKNNNCEETLETRKDFKQIFLNLNNCSITFDIHNDYIGNYKDITKVIVGDKVDIKVSESSNYIINKLVYCIGTMQGSEFIASSEEIYIYNNSFIMPDSDIQIICECVKKTQTATLKNNQVMVSVNHWMPANMTINSVNVTIWEKALVKEQNINYQGDSRYSQVFNVSTEEFNVYNSRTSVGLGVGFTFKNSGEYSVHAGNGVFNEYTSSTGVEIVGNILTFQQTYQVKLWNNLLNTVEEHDITFTVTMYVNVKTQHRVTYISENDEVENITLNTGDLITNIPEGEWFLDEDYTQAWNFATDVVDKDIVLYKKSV